MNSYKRLVSLIEAEISISKSHLEKMKEKRRAYLEKGNQRMAYYFDGQIVAEEQEVQTLEMILKTHKENKNE